MPPLWSSYWRLAWRQRPPTKFFSLYRAIPPLITGAIQFRLLRDHRPLNDMWKTALIVLVVYMSLYVLETAWNLVSLSPPILYEKLKEHAEEMSRDLAALQEALRATAEGRLAKFSFWLEVDKAKKPATTIMRYSTRGPSATLHTDLPQTSLAVLNEGQLPLKVLGFSLRAQEANGNPEELDHHQVVIPPMQTARLDATSALMGVLSGPAPWDFSKIEGCHTLTTSIQYEQDSDIRQSEQTTWFARASLSGGVFDFDISSQPFPEKGNQNRYRRKITSEPLYKPILTYENIDGSEGYCAVGGMLLLLQLMNIRNTECDVETTANNVVARLEYIHAGGDRFVVKQALWLTKAEERDTLSPPEPLTSAKFIGTNSAGHLAFLAETQDRVFLAPLSTTQVRELNPGRWTIKVFITADNCDPLAGEIGLVVFPNKRFEYDRPAFRRAET